MPTDIRSLLNSDAPLDKVEAVGWVRTRRDAKKFSFLEINDGSCLANLQTIVDLGIPGSEDLPKAGTGASVRVKGKLVESGGEGQSWELIASEFELVGEVEDGFPLQKKGHSPEFLREIAHLRTRSNLFGCVFRLRSGLSFAVHQFFRERGFHHVHTPIITTSDCEGAGEMFRVTTLEPGNVKTGEDFFGGPAFLTVSGQLEAETFATALGKVYTFGPTFRAENSNTTRHASEFWMIEPEMAFCDLQGDMDLAEEFIGYLLRFALEEHAEDLSLFDRFVEKGLIRRLEKLAESKYERIAYRDAVALLEKSEQRFEHPVGFGLNLQSEHERYLSEKHVGGPVTIFDYPKDIKPFYMRRNDDGETVAAMDVLVPGIGEIIGGSQREERLDLLKTNLAEDGLSEEAYSWYLDLRRYGTVPHAGFGMGFERLLMYVSGVSNIRDVIPFARTPGNASF